jgi:hypothetical protein
LSTAASARLAKVGGEVPAPSLPALQNSLLTTQSFAVPLAGIARPAPRNLL